MEQLLSVGEGQGSMVVPSNQDLVQTWANRRKNRCFPERKQRIRNSPRSLRARTSEVAEHFLC